MALRGIIDRCRVSGFPLGFSLELLDTLFQVEEVPPAHIVPRDEAWPPVPRAMFPFSEPSTPTLPHFLPAIVPLVQTSAGARTLIQEIEDEMNKQWLALMPEIKDYDAGYPILQDRREIKSVEEPVREHQTPLPEMTVSEHRSPDASTQGTSSARFQHCNTTDTPTSTLNPIFYDSLPPIRSHRNNNIAAENVLSISTSPPCPISNLVKNRDLIHTQVPSTPVPSPVSDFDNASARLISDITVPTSLTSHLVSSPLLDQRQTLDGSTPPAPLTPLMAPTCFQDQRQIRTPISALRPRTPISVSRIPRAVVTPSPRAKTPNRMNALNEQDPAFIRTLSAMRAFDGRLKPQTHIASPIKAIDALGISTPGPSKRKYLSFVNRLRGLPDT